MAKEELPFFNRHVVHGKIEAQGEEHSDHWFLVVENNKARAVESRYQEPKLVPLDTELVNKVSQNSSEVKAVEKQMNDEQTPKDLYKKKGSRFNL